jgi:hypothetical protein
MFFEEIDGGKCVSFRVVCAAKDKVNNVFIILLTVPTSFFGINFLSFLRSETEIFCFGQDLNA